MKNDRFVYCIYAYGNDIGVLLGVGLGCVLLVVFGFFVFCLLVFGDGYFFMRLSWLEHTV